MDAENVVAYLRRHKNFFTDYEDLLDDLNLPHLTEAGSASFIQHQLSRSRRQCKELQERLESYTSIVNQNTNLVLKLYQLASDLLSVPIGQREEVLCSSSQQYFSVDIVRLRRFASGAAEWDSDPMRSFNPDAPDSTELTEEMAEVLFSDRSYRSVCMVPLGKRGGSGVVLFGSKRSDRFVSGDHTLLLDQYAKMAYAALFSQQDAGPS